MKQNFTLLLIVLLLGCSGPRQAMPVSNPLEAKDLFPVGRTLLHDQEGLELIGSAAHFSFSFSGKSCQIFVSETGQDHNYIQYELDGVYQKRLRVSRSETGPLLIEAPTDGIHRVQVFKATEAQTGPIFIQKIEGASLQAIAPPKVPVIEFIGNSITCGAAADPSEVPCGQGEYHDQHNAYFAYGPRVARALGYEYFLSSVSGIGIYRNWNSDGPAMPEVYEHANLREDGTERWKFETYRPVVVSIALGTNDLSRGDGHKKRLPFDSVSFVHHYTDFVRVVKSKYPAARIALLSSPMINGTDRNLLQNCLTAVKQAIDPLYPNDRPVALYFFPPMQARGCSGHPNVEDHAILAGELEPFFRQLVAR
jgi:Carbohydrate esterase 2 N-terminal/GDSL-like Lipase/Acylhydrolase family